MTPNAKLVLLVTALLMSSISNSCSPREEVVPYLDAILDAAASSSTEDLVALVHFSEMPCTTGDGLGGPPKCLAGEEEGTLVDVLPFLGPEGHHMRRSDLASWPGIRGASLYAVFRTPSSTYSDEFYPAGDFGVAFMLPDGVNAVVLQVSDAGVVRVDYTFLDGINAVLDDAQVILGPNSPSE